jgi:hypothetical protein
VISSVGRIGSLAPDWPNAGYVYGGARVTEIAGSGRDSIMVFDTQLDAADYLISYRVLECGIVYRKGEEKSKKREAMVRLHIRVQDTGSGQILYANNIEGSLEDEVEAEVLDDLEDFRYSFYSHDLPLERGVPSGRREIENTQEGSQSPALRIAILLGGAVAASIAALSIGS